MKVLQINTTVSSSSTGRITEEIGKVLISNGHESYVAFGRGDRPSQSKLIRIGNQRDIIRHQFKSALFDRHGFGSVKATRKLIKEIDKINPDAIGLHNLHGYYLNVELLFEYLHIIDKPVIWTLHDCWSFTGHCSYFDDINCNKWITGCFSCPKTRKYPSSYLLDKSKKNFQDKRLLFTKLAKLNIIVYSQWLKGLVEKSFLKIHPVYHIFNGIDLDVFKPSFNTEIRKKYNIKDGKIILGVANIWDLRKGLDDFKQLYKHLEQDQILVLVGLSKKQIEELPLGIVGVAKTESVSDLAALYSEAEVFVNPTWLDNFPTTNIEALACGTPVVTYNTGGSPESIDQDTGLVVDKGNLPGLANAIKIISQKGKNNYLDACRLRAERLFDKRHRYSDYIDLFQTLIEK